jgi:putative transposase
VYLKGYGNPMELMIGLTEYFVFYNNERPHQSLGNRTPAEVYATGSNGRGLQRAPAKHGTG